MSLTIEINDTELLKEIENCTFDTTFFTHNIMLRLSWILIQKYGLKEATIKNCEIKENYYKNVLKNDKFNLPLTKAYTDILYHFMEKSASPDNFDKLLSEFPRLKYNFKKLVKNHYGYNILKEDREKEIGKRPILFNF